MKPPHILLASSNPNRLLENLKHIVNGAAIEQIQSEIERNVLQLLSMGKEFLMFSSGLPSEHWRHRTSRLYYAAYLVFRAVRLASDGHYSTESEEHKRISKQIPTGFPDRERYMNQLGDLRDDRNLADYDHSIDESDLLFTFDEAKSLVTDFIRDSEIYLKRKGIEFNDFLG